MSLGLMLRSALILSVAAVVAACAPSSGTAPAASAPSATAPAEVGSASSAPASPAPAAAQQPDTARGGRLFDNWVAEKQLGDRFKPDSSKTPELDGTGGPFGNGTLKDGQGKPMPNPGHDYRLKNLFGWDLRGTAGIYGPKYQAKAYALPTNLLQDSRSPEQLREWLSRGDDRVPAYGDVLDERDWADLIAFVTAVKSGELPHPEAIFELSEGTAKNYKLRAGGDAAAGRAHIAQTCARCHGADGTRIKIDETESVGSLARTSGYEVWLKILNGHPGSSMGRQVREAGAGQQILDILAALCDRTAFPALGGSQDVPDGDPRCGAYLK